MYDIYEKLKDVAQNKSILIVDDNDEITDELEKLFILFFSNVQRASNGQEGFQKAKVSNFDVIITDLEMPVMNGVDMIRKIKTETDNNKFIALSGFIDTYLNELEGLGVTEYMEKPYYVEKLFNSIINLISK